MPSWSANPPNARTTLGRSPVPLNRVLSACGPGVCGETGSPGRYRSRAATASPDRDRQRLAGASKSETLSGCAIPVLTTRGQSANAFELCRNSVHE
jgi:hypothetical protein